MIPLTLLNKLIRSKRVWIIIFYNPHYIIIIIIIIIIIYRNI